MLKERRLLFSFYSKLRQLGSVCASCQQGRSMEPTAVTEGEREDTFLSIPWQLQIRESTMLAVLRRGEGEGKVA